MKKPAKKRKGRRSRFKTGKDAEDQLKQIEAAQRAAREGIIQVKIESIEKSRQRFEHRLDQIRNVDDALEEFE